MTGAGSQPGGEPEGRPEGRPGSRWFGEVPEGGRARADWEFRWALVIAVPVFVIGQVLLVSGLRWVALFGIALPGTAAALALARRWTRLASGDR
jgi:hypothetical protein